MYDIGCNSISKQWPHVIFRFLDMSNYCSELSNVVGGYKCCCKEVGYLFSIIEVLPQITFDTILAWASNLKLLGFFVGFLRRVLALESFEAMIWRSSWASEPFQSQLGTGERSRVHLVLYTRTSSPAALSSADVRCPSTSVWKRRAVHFSLFDSLTWELAHGSFKLYNKPTISYYYYTYIHNWTWQNNLCSTECKWAKLSPKKWPERVQHELLEVHLDTGASFSGGWQWHAMPAAHNWLNWGSWRQRVVASWQSFVIQRP